MRRISVKLWVFYVVACLLVLLCVRLGFWQIHRADEKTLMLQAREQQSHQVPKKLSPDWSPNNYQPVGVTGSFLPITLYLDNQHYQHQFGYDIITPFRLKSGQVVLVNRGWVAGDRARRHQPKVETPKGNISLSGYTYYPQKVSWQLGPQVEKKSAAAYLIERVDVALLAAELGIELEPYIVRLDNASKAGYVRAWKIVSMPPARHIGYAIQWFLMSVVLLIMIGYFFRKQSYEKRH